MSETLADVQSRLENIRQLDAVVTAMRGIAAARVQQSRKASEGIAAYTATVSGAIGEALGLPSMRGLPPAPPPKGKLVIVFAAEQGLAGGYNNKVLEGLGTPGADDILLVVGSRGALALRERGLSPAWSLRMASQIGAVADIAGQVADELYRRIAAGPAAHADLVHARLDGSRRIVVERTALFPLDYSSFRSVTLLNPPLITLPAAHLLESLAAEYVYARLCEAATEAFACENQSRLDAMGAASSNIGRKREDLTRRENQLRQEAVTTELIELAAGAGLIG